LSPIPIIILPARPNHLTSLIRLKLILVEYRLYFFEDYSKGFMGWGGLLLFLRLGWNVVCYSYTLCYVGQGWRWSEGDEWLSIWRVVGKVEGWDYLGGNDWSRNLKQVLIYNFRCRILNKHFRCWPIPITLDFDR
jgi:hypothetical protein